ncbi:hypothetical protein [Caproicibacterium sp. XB2]|uniref:hypothetical protein n=1 Tax=Caproicibacterium sp. XB2 TaxID=3388458 RepID=UPI003851156E
MKFNESASHLETTKSLPTRERGLKSPLSLNPSKFPAVAPYTGAWIEILSHSIILPIELSRSLHGSVD